MQLRTKPKERWNNLLFSWGYDHKLEQILRNNNQTISRTCAMFFQFPSSSIKYGINLNLFKFCFYLPCKKTQTTVWYLAHHKTNHKTQIASCHMYFKLKNYIWCESVIVFHLNVFYFWRDQTYPTWPVSQVSYWTDGRTSTNDWTSGRRSGPTSERTSRKTSRQMSRWTSGRTVRRTSGRTS